MRAALRLLALTAVWCAPLAAQQPKQVSPFGLAVGPAWTQGSDLFGLQLRGEYTPVRYRWFGLQLDAGGAWSPAGSIHLHLGIAETLTLFPLARLSPYGVLGIAAVQSWSTRSGDPGSGTHGKVDGLVGVGLRFWSDSRPVQIEMRRFGDSIIAFTIGTALH